MISNPEHVKEVFAGVGLACGLFTFIALILYKLYLFVEDKDLWFEQRGIFTVKCISECIHWLIALMLSTLGGVLLSLLVYGLFKLVLIIFGSILYAPLTWAGVGAFIVLIFVARYGRRTHKLLYKHMQDKDAHK